YAVWGLNRADRCRTQRVRRSARPPARAHAPKAAGPGAGVRVHRRERWPTGLKPWIALALGAVLLIVILAAAARLPAVSEEIKPTLRSVAALTGARTGPGAARLELTQTAAQAEAFSYTDLVEV